MKNSSMQFIEKLLNEMIGLSVESVGTTAIENSVEYRINRTGCSDISDYRDLLSTSENEVRELINHVVIPETWFFRDSSIYGDLNRRVTDIQKTGRTPRVLCMPCATGEEAYSVYINLAENNLEHDIDITGADVSDKVINIAREAVYTRNSFRENPLNIDWDKYFRMDGSCHHLADSVKNNITLKTANILDRKNTRSLGMYDIILCRNLLIYFDNNARRIALENFTRLLKHEGIIFFGYAESSTIEHEHLHRTQGFGSCAFIHSETAPENAIPAMDTTIAARRKKRIAITNPFKKYIKEEKPEPVSVNENDRQSAIGSIRHLADHGEYEKALTGCNVLLESTGPDIEIFHLIGLIAEAAGDDSRAEENFRKSLYLDPDHYDSLVHLSLIKQTQGKHDEARILSNRATKAKASSS